MTSVRDQPLRVLFAILSYEPGGGQRQTLDLIARIDRRKIQPVLYVQNPVGVLQGEVPWETEVVVLPDWMHQHGLVRRLSRIPGCGRIARSLAITGILRERKIQAVYNRVYNLTLDFAFPCWWRRVPRISVCVGDQAVEVRRHSQLSLALSWQFARWAYQTASLVLANSQELRTNVCEYFRLPSRQVRTLYNGIDVDRCRELAAQGPTPDWKPACFRLLTVGRVDDQKGLADILRSLHELSRKESFPAWTWHVLGDGPERPRLEQLASELGLTDRIVWHGSVANPFPWYASADLFVMASLTEGLPNVLLEALACGLPVISSDCPTGPREILDKGRMGILFAPGDVPALTAALRERVTRPIDRAAFAEEATGWLRATFDAASITTEIEGLLEAVSRLHSRR